MKKIIYLFNIVLICGLYSCEKLPGSIYGMVVESSNTEPLAGLGVELYRIGKEHNSLLLKTVTFDDGHFEFTDLKPEEYLIKVIAEGYDEASTQYYVIVEEGRQARVDMQVILKYTYMTVVTNTPQVNDKDRVVQLSMTVTWWSDGWGNTNESPLERGFRYAAHNQPISMGTVVKLPSESSSIELQNLDGGTYYVVAYAINEHGIAFGEMKQFTLSDNPIITTLEPSNISYTTASYSARIDYLGSAQITERGFVYSSTFQNPTIDDSPSFTTRKIVSGTSTEFSVNVSDLIKNNIYYVRAYLTTTKGRYYGETKSFKATPFQLPTFTFGGSLYYVSPDQGEATWNDAKSICSNLVYADYADWYLPDEGELNVMYEQKSSIGGFSNVDYWSSREYSSDRAGYQHFSDGYQSHSYKSNTKRVRCVRREN